MEVRRMRPRPKANPLDKKIKPNPKYNKVETVINTGNNLRKELERLGEVQLFYKFRNDEIFRRININNLVRLMIEVMKLEHQLEPRGGATYSAGVLPEDSVSEADFTELGEQEEAEEEGEEEEDIGSLIQSQFQPGGVRRSRVGTARSVTSVVEGVGELDGGKGEVEEESTPNRPFLLLDVREEDSFLRSHLVLAHHYPHTRLNRCYDYETKEMQRLKNKGRSVIVVYDQDESTASRVATTLTQRGYDNVFLLSGGLRVAARKFPESLITSGPPCPRRLEEGEVMVLEQLLEDSIMAGSSSRLSRASSLNTIARGGMDNWRSGSLEGPMRTSTAMRNRL